MIELLKMDLLTPAIIDAARLDDFYMVSSTRQ